MSDLNDWSGVISKIGEENRQREAARAESAKAQVAAIDCKKLTSQALLDMAFGGIAYGDHNVSVSEQLNILRDNIRLELTDRLAVVAPKAEGVRRAEAVAADELASMAGKRFDTVRVRKLVADILEAAR